jgi:hypothetical protein
VHDVRFDESTCVPTEVYEERRLRHQLLHRDPDHPRFSVLHAVVVRALKSFSSPSTLAPQAGDRFGEGFEIVR